MATALHDRSRVPTDGNVKEEFAALLAGAGVYDLGSRAKIALRGEDRVRWLNGMVTNNVRDLAEGHGIYAYLLNPQGHILADLYAYNRGDTLLVDTDRSQAEKVLATFDHYIIMDDVEAENISGKLTALGIAGPKAPETLHSAGIQLPTLAPLYFANISWRDKPVTVLRSDHPRIESFELWLAPENVPALREALTNAGGSPIGSSALDLFRIALGTPRYGQDIRERDLPQETGQDRALNFSKGCYVGQEIVERIRSRGAVHRTFTGFLVEGSLPLSGTKIQADGKEVGEITSTASLPLKGGDLPVALGYLRREAAVPGKPLEAAGARLTAARLPFAQVFSD